MSINYHLINGHDKMWKFFHCFEVWLYSMVIGHSQTIDNDILIEWNGFAFAL